MESACSSVKPARKAAGGRCRKTAISPRTGIGDYEGLQYLEEGDDFTVFADDGSVLWHGIIHQDTKTGAIPHRVIRKGKVVVDNSWKQQVVGGMWVHWIQKGMDPEAWGELFCGEKRCLLKREEKC